MHFIIRSVWLKALGMSLVSNLWQMALIWALYILVTGRGSRFSASVRHSLATIGVAVGTGCFIISLLSNLLTGTGLSIESNWLMVPFPSSTWFYAVFNITRQYMALCLPYLSFAYLITLIYLSARYFRFFRHTREIRSLGLHKMQPGLRLFVSEISKRLGIRKPVAIWLSSVVETPMTLGFLRPVILIPFAIVNQLTIQQVETILLHELAHIKRNDYLLNLLITLSGILFFFNPFSKLLIHTIRKERENCCDDLVIQFRYEPADYASALLSLEKTRHHQQTLILAAIGKSNQLLLERIRRFTGQKNPLGLYHSKLIGSLLLAMALSLILVFQIRQAKPKELIKSFMIAGIETKNKTYSGPKLLTISVIKNNKPTGKKTKKPYTFHQEEINALTLISNDETAQDDAENSDANVALQSTPRESSIMLPASTSAPVVASTGSFPFVPSASFSYQILEDTARPGSFSSRNDVAKAEKSLEKALEALDEVDWNNIEKGLVQNGRQVYAKEILVDIHKSIHKLNLERISLDENTDLSEADETRIKEDIQLQQQSIDNCKLSKDFPTKQLLQKQVLIEKLRLQKNWERKQRELVRKIEEIKKKSRIVYI